MTRIPNLIVACSFATVFLLAGRPTFAQEPGTKIYIPPPAPNQTLVDGTKVVTTTTAPAFNQVLQAEIFRSKLPFKIVSDSSEADYYVDWAAIPEEGNATTSLAVLGTYGTGRAVRKELYTVTVSFLGKDRQLVWADNVDKKNLRDAAKMIALQLKHSMKPKGVTPSRWRYHRQS